MKHLKNYNFILKKRIIKCKCKDCGSNDVIINYQLDNFDSSNDWGGEHSFNPMELTQNLAKKLIKNLIKSETIWCCNNCEDETSVVVEIDGKKIIDPVDFIEYISDYGNPKLDIIVNNSNNTTKKKRNIFKSVKFGEFDVIKNYILEGGDLNANDGDDTLLMIAIDNGHYDIAIELINNGCNVNTTFGYSNSTPLMNIFSSSDKSKKKFDVIDTLMKHGLDLNIKDRVNKTVLDYVRTFNSYKEEKFIIDNYPEQYKEYLRKK